MLASEGLALWGGLVVQMLGELLLPLMADLARLVNTRSRDHAGAGMLSTAVSSLLVPTGASHRLAILAGTQAGLRMTGCAIFQGEGLPRRMSLPLLVPGMSRNLEARRGCCSARLQHLLLTMVPARRLLCRHSLGAAGPHCTL